MLSEHALALIRDVFGLPSLFRELPRIQKRVVAWGAASRPAAFEHSAVVVSEEALLASLQPPISNGPDQEAAAGWTVIASRPLPAPAVEHAFGSRIASVVPVTLSGKSDPNACWIESLQDGWLFLIPANRRSAWLLAVGHAPQTLLGSSHLVAPQIAESGEAVGEFPSSPRLASPLCGAGWLACGTAAMAFDPICGDGTAHAVREAILASAVIRALAKGGHQPSLFSHYEGRLTAGFKRHLLLCRDFYQVGGDSPWWKAELEEILHGIAWCDRALGAKLEFRYQLKGFELQAIP